MDISWEMEENSVITVVDFYLRRRPSCMVEAHSKNVASRKNFLWPNLVWRWSIRNVVQLLCLQFTISPLWIWRFIPPSRTSLKRLKAGWKVWKCSWLLVITIANPSWSSSVILEWMQIWGTVILLAHCCRRAMSRKIWWEVQRKARAEDNAWRKPETIVNVCLTFNCFLLLLCSCLHGLATIPWSI